ncbi:MAG: MFS transporter [Chitinophagales bacterium]
MKTTKQLSFRNYLGFGLGDYAFNLYFQGATLFLLYFYTDILGIEAATAGTIFLIATIWDAVTDPLMGYFAGKTRTRWGRYRPYLLLAPIPLGLSYMFMFYQVAYTGTALILWAIALQILFRTFFTLGNIPYSSLSSEMTFNSQARSKLAAYRMFLGYAGAMTVSVFTGSLMAVMGWLPNENGYFYVGIVFAILAALLFVFCFQNTFELPPKPSAQGVSFKDTLQMLQHNRPFWQICAFIMFGMAGVVIFYQSLSYYFKYNLQNEAALGQGMMYLFTCLMLSLPVWLQLSAKIGKRNTLLAGCAVILLGSLTFYFNPWAQQQVYWAYVHMAIIGTGIGCAAFSFWAMLPDTVEYGEWKSGIRAEAILFGLGLFFLKLSLGLGSFILGLLLEGIGYAPNVDQSVEALQGIHAIATLGIAVSGVGIVLVMWFYPLTKEVYEGILEELNTEAE